MKTTGSMEGPLSDVVARSLRRYLSDLNGESPSELYALVLKEVEAPMLAVIMEHTAQNQSRAAEMLGINRNTLRKKLKAHGLDRGAIANRSVVQNAAPANVGMTNSVANAGTVSAVAPGSHAGGHTGVSGDHVRRDNYASSDNGVTPVSGANGTTLPRNALGDVDDHR